MFKIILFLIGIVAVILLGLSLYVVIKPYFLSFDTCTLFTGGNGSGKTFFAVKYAIIQLKKNRLKVFLKNINPVRRLIYKKPKIKRPVLISSIPIRINAFEKSIPLDYKPMVLLERLPEYCVVLIDEINLFVSQMDYKLVSEKQLNEFVTLFRHQTKGGSLFLTTQNVNKVHWVFRYCCNRAYNLCEFKKPFLGLPILAWCKCRNISIGDDIKMVEDENLEDGYRNLFSFFPVPRQYDTHVHSERYAPLPLYKRNRYKILKRNSVINLDKSAKFPVLINETDDVLLGGAGSESENPTLKQDNCSFSYNSRKSV